MASEMQKLVVKNIDQDSLLLAISEREDVLEVMKMFRDNSDYAPREYMNIKQFSEYIQASDKYVRNLAKHAEENKLFCTTRVGREIRIDRLSYEKWVRNGGRF